MDMLTSPTGADQAWSTVDVNGDTLGGRDGQELLSASYCRDGSALPLSLEGLRRTFRATSEINFCCCRGQDFEQKTAKVVLDEALHSVTTDLAYHKEHAALTLRASEWLKSGDVDDVVLRGDDLRRQERWLEEADYYEKNPRPTDAQRDFVAKSVNVREEKSAAARRRGRYLRAASIVAVILISIGFVVSVAIYAEAVRQVAGGC